MQPTAVSYAVVVPVMAWAVYRRLRRHFGAQPLQRGYYLSYYGGLLWRRRQLRPASAQGTRDQMSMGTRMR